MKYPRITRKKVTAVAASVILAASLASCSSTPAAGPAKSQKPVTITFWDDNGGPARTPVYKKLIAQFEKANPKITVDYVGIPAADSATKLQTAVAGGSVPDVGIVPDYLISSLEAQNALVPLDSRLAKSDLKNEIASDALTAAHGAVYNHKLYYLPFTTTTATMWYRGDWFKAAGVSLPKTWPQFFSDAVKMNQPAAGKYGFSLRGAAGSVNQLVSVAVGCGGVSSIIDSNGKSTMDRPKVVSCISKYADMYKKVTAPADLGNAYPQMVAEFDGGHAAIMLHNLGSTVNHEQALGKGVAIGLSLPAVSAGGKRYLVSGSTEGPVIFSGSSHQDAAWKWSSFLLEHGPNSYWNQQAGQLPTNIAARKDAWAAQSQPISDSVKVLAEKTTVNVAPPLYLPEWGSTLTGMEADFQSVLLGKESAKAFATKLADELNAAEADYRKNFGSKK